MPKAGGRVQERVEECNNKKGGGATAGVMGSARAGEKGIAITEGEVQKQERRETSANREIEKQERRVCQSRRGGGMQE